MVGLDDTPVYLRGRRNVPEAFARDHHRHSDQKDQFVCDCKILEVVGEGGVAGQALA